MFPYYILSEFQYVSCTDSKVLMYRVHIWQEPFTYKCSQEYVVLKFTAAATFCFSVCFLSKQIKGWLLLSGKARAVQNTLWEQCVSSCRFGH